MSSPECRRPTQSRQPWTWKSFTVFRDVHASRSLVWGYAKGNPCQIVELIFRAP
jgi:hypothetical protein